MNTERRPEKSMTVEQIKKVLELVKDNSYSDIATQLGVTKFQINRVLMNAKQQLRKSASNDKMDEKVEDYIERFLTPPEDIVPGKVTVKSALFNIIDDILRGMDNENTKDTKKVKDYRLPKPVETKKRERSEPLIINGVENNCYECGIPISFLSHFCDQECNKIFLKRFKDVTEMKRKLGQITKLRKKNNLPHHINW